MEKDFGVMQRLVIIKTTSNKYNMEKKKFTKKQLIEFARHCMIQLIQKPAKKTTSGMSEISSYDLTRISTVLNEYQ